MISAQVVAELVAAGLSGDALIAALRRIEDASQASHVTSPPSPGSLRTRRYRERHKASQSVTVTSQASQVTETPTIPIEDTNTDVSCETPIGISASPSRTSLKRQTATRLPENWRPKPISDDFRSKLGFGQARLAAEFEQFRDHMLAKPGERGRSMDWDRSWHTWLRNAAKWEAERNSQRRTGNGRPPLRDEFAGALDLIDKKYGQGEEGGGADILKLPGLRQGS